MSRRLRLCVAVMRVGPFMVPHPTACAGIPRHRQLTFVGEDLGEFDNNTTPQPNRWGERDRPARAQTDAS